MTWRTVCRIGREFDGVEESTSYGTPALKVRGKLLVRLREDGETLVLMTTFVDRDLLLRDNVVSAEAQREGRILPALGIEPTTIEAIVPSYLWRFRKTGQFQHNGA